MNPSTPLPLPHDIPLPLPVDRFLLDTAIVFLFLAHILFVNFMVGGSTLTLAYELIGLRNKKYDALARQWSSTITVNKSLAVVLGVAPLLVINVLYTMYIYTANSLTGSAWMMKRTKFSPMPAFAHLPETDLQAVAEYMLEME